MNAQDIFDLKLSELNAQAEIARLKAELANNILDQLAVAVNAKAKAEAERDEYRARAEKAEATLVYCADWLAYRGVGPGIDLVLLKIRDILAGRKGEDNTCRFFWLCEKRESARKPAEERGPEGGDVVVELDMRGEIVGHVFEWESDFTHDLSPGWRRIIIMRRAEVEARVKENMK